MKITKIKYQVIMITKDDENNIQRHIMWESFPEDLDKKEHWLTIYTSPFVYECSKCGCVEDKKTKFCPNCGATMNLEWGKE